MEQEQSAYITSVHLKGYKSIRDLSVDLKQGLNIIIGANGSGKTNFLEFLDAAYQSDYAKLFNGQNRKFECEIIGKPISSQIKGERTYLIDLKNVAYKVEEQISIDNEKNETVYFLDEDKKVVKQVPLMVGFFVDFSINQTIFLQFENPLNDVLQEKLSLNVVREMNSLVPPYFYEDELHNVFHSNLKIKNGSNVFLKSIFFNQYKKVINNYKKISEIINEITENEVFLLNTLRDNLKQFSPIKDIKIDWALARRTIQEDEYENGESMESALIDGFDFHFYINDEWLSWTQLSDGTKRLFYIIGSVTYAKVNEIILIEEPELGVHPHQLSLLMDFIKARSKDKQIIISTHSPEVLNCLKEDELDRIIVARHEGKAGTKMYKLSEKEEKSLKIYMKNQASISDYWLQTGFEKEEVEA